MPVVESDVEASPERLRRGPSGSAAPSAAAEAGARPGEETARVGLRRRERSANEKKCQISPRTIIGLFLLRVPLRDVDVVDLKSRGCRKLKGGNTGVPMFVGVAMFTCVVLYRCCCCCVAAVLRASEIQRKCVLQQSLVVFRMARTHNTNTQKHRS